MFVFAHPTISKTQPLYFVTYVTLHVLNVQLTLIPVPNVLLIELQELNQTVHAQVINTKLLMDIVLNVHSDVVNVQELLILVMVKNVLTGQELWTIAIV
jgi:hypothetical protein